MYFLLGLVTAFCLTRQQAIQLIAHLSDVVHPNTLAKEIIWQIGDRESGLTMCGNDGKVKISRTNDHGLIQMNPQGVWKNCRLNFLCKNARMIDDPQAQLEVMFNYYRVYHDLCPWNPRGSYMPGCGYP